MFFFLPCLVSHSLFLPLYLPLSFSHPCLSNYLSLSLSPAIVSLSILLSYPSLLSLSLSLSLSHFPIPISLSLSLIPVVSLSFSHSCLPFYLSLTLSLSLSLFLCLSVFLPPLSLYLLFSLSRSLSFYRSLSHSCLSLGCGLLCAHKKSFNTAIPVTSLGPYMYVHYCTYIVHILV